jgi:hypothetical protein
MSKQEQLNNIESDMENWLPKTGEMRELLEPVAESSARYLQATDDVYQSLIIETAQGQELENIGNPLGVYRNTNEKDELYQARIKSFYRQIINNGSPSDIIESLSLILNISKQSVIVENGGGVEFRVKVPLKSLQNKSFTENNIENILNTLSAATYTISVTGSGTLEYITPSEYNTGTTDEGYADSESGIDSDNRGTYSEVID